MLFIILTAFILLILCSGFYFFYRIGKPVNGKLSDAYYHHAWKKKVVYSPMGNWFELGYHETEADPATFTVIAKEYGKDAQFVYWKGRKQDVDQLTFEVSEEQIPRDGEHVYFEPDYENALTVIADADPKTYRQYKEGSTAWYQYWHQDKNYFFVDGKKLAVDRNTFVRLTYPWA
jgi:DKNYY family